MNFNSFDYPRDKIEWIIVDDSDNDETERQLPPVESRGKYNINYIRPSVQADKLMSGEKRNLAIRNSKMISLFVWMMMTAIIQILKKPCNYSFVCLITKIKIHYALYVLIWNI